MRVISCHCRVVSVTSGHEFFWEIKKNMRVIASHCRVVSVGRGVSNKHPLGKRVSNEHPLETYRVLFEQPLRVSFRVDVD